MISKKVKNIDILPHNNDILPYELEATIIRDDILRKNNSKKKKNEVAIFALIFLFVKF